MNLTNSIQDQVSWLNSYYGCMKFLSFTLWDTLV